jgi:hypothetical protein
MNNSFSKSYLFLPVKILLIFNLITLIFFALGPINWMKINEVKVIFYVCFNLLFFFIGYYIGINGYAIKESFNYDNKKWVVLSVIFVSLFWFLPSLYLRLGITGFNILEVYDKLIEGFKNPSIAYYEKISSIEDNRGGEKSLMKLINFLLSPLIYAFFPFCILYFNKFNLSVKIIIIACFILELISWISIGTNKGVVDLFLVTVFVGIIVKPNLLKLNIKQVALFSFLIVLVLYFFISNMLSRYGALGDSDILYSLDFNVLNNPLKTTGIYSQLNMALTFGLTLVTAYLAQGYYNLGLALQETGVWTYGFGNSWMGIEIWRLFTGGNLLPETYMGVLEKKHFIDPMIAWHSIYTWLANDFTFWGVPFIFFLIGYNLATSWLDSIHKRSVYASIVFCLFCQMIFYFYANNQIFSFSLIPFLIFYILWQVDRKKIRLNFNK